MHQSCESPVNICNRSFWLDEEGNKYEIEDLETSDITKIRRLMDSDKYFWDYQLSPLQQKIDRVLYQRATEHIYAI